MSRDGGKQKDERVGALWSKTSQGSGSDFFSGSLEIPQSVLDEAEIDDQGRVKIPVVVFYVKNKRNPRGPDLDILLGRNGGERSAGGGARQEARGGSRPAPAAPVTDDDIPF